MRVVYLANVGTRDLTRNGRPTSNCRADGEAWLHDYDAVKDELDTPILLPGLRYVLQHVNQLDVLLFYSDQDETVAEEHRSRDTVYLAQVLRRLLPERLPGRVREVRLARLLGNPADYNEMMAFFSGRLHELLAPDEVDALYVAPVGGADASNVSLTVNAVRLYRWKCQFIYVMPDGHVEPLHLHQELLGDYARQEAKAHLARHDYTALRETLEQMGLGKPWQQHLCEYADRRSRFDFKRAQEALQAAMQAAESGEIKLKLARIQETLQPFLREQDPPTSTSDEATWTRWFELQRYLLSELFFNLKLKAERGEWVDFLGRLFRLYEALLRLIFELETRHSTEKQGDIGFADFVSAIEANTDLRDYLVTKKARLGEANTRNLLLVLEFWVRHGKGKEYGRLRETLKVIGGQELSSLRHKTIIAHGYRGVSQEDVEEAAGKPVGQLIEEIRAALDMIGASTVEESNPYTAVKELLQEIVK